jgi:hypothetical protein
MQGPSQNMVKEKDFGFEYVNNNNNNNINNSMAGELY